MKRAEARSPVLFTPLLLFYARKPKLRGLTTRKNSPRKNEKRCSL